MVPKGLQVGDTFRDGQQTFVVEAVNRNGTYDSKAVKKAGGSGEAAPHQSAARKRRGKKQ